MVTPNSPRPDFGSQLVRARARVKSKMMSDYRKLGETEIDSCVDQAFFETFETYDSSKTSSANNVFCFMRQIAVFRIIDMQRKRGRSRCEFCDGLGQNSSGQPCRHCDGGWTGPQVSGLECEPPATDIEDDFPEEFSQEWLNSQTELVQDVVGQAVEHLSTCQFKLIWCKLRACLDEEKREELANEYGRTGATTKQKAAALRQNLKRALDWLRGRFADDNPGVAVDASSVESQSLSSTE